MIRLSDFPQLRMLAWNRPAEAEVDDAEALALYEANWRFVEPETLNEAEAALLRRLVQEQGAGLLLV
ncbi:MAG: hypothetical protein E6Q94_12390 [Burkholderiaceae bacterium]|nr:MAG: hypothetical protein E6Q94_12390 [Burkholderiaceae bacterium]